MTLIQSFNFNPASVFAVEKFTVWPRINIGTIEHLTMNQAEAFECYNYHCDVQLADGDHKRPHKFFIRNEHIYHVTEYELTWRVLVSFTVMIDPIMDIYFLLFLH